MTIERFKKQLKRYEKMPNLKLALVEAILRHQLKILRKDELTKEIKDTYKKVRFFRMRLLFHPPFVSGGFYLETDGSFRDGFVYIRVVVRDEHGMIRWPATLVEHEDNMPIHPRDIHVMEEDEGIFMARRKLKAEEP
ncbi:unnamed protein product [Linum trigynum]|uniref:Uncharacterized protein n=1 Tax=Linum trigynum TaxID=586398 RepID=A0AAV2F021_9ROSI